MKDKLRIPMLKIIEELKESGLNLAYDEATCNITYSEHPEVIINISVGGLFFEPQDEDEELH